MSNIPEARRLLQEAIAGDNSYDSTSMYGAIVEALALLDRKKPAFVAPRKVSKLSPFNVKYARELRAAGLSMNDIARVLKTNGGRISEACS